ncbi:transmembrane protein 164-like [Lytechinus pictus]|uniref:transmembrane protein 164-like n=1 Tax=Lytechinus pictus TaxID=7653 RepID=UPI0030BA095D
MNTTEAPNMWTMDSLGWLYEGVDPKFAGNGGPDCNNFLSVKQRVIETIIFVILGTLECWYAWQRLGVNDPRFEVEAKDKRERFGKRFLLVILCMTFGVEIGFKFATKTVIYLLNPCHMLTVVQIYLLAAPPSKLVRVIFRMQMASLSCPLLALLLPVVNTRLLPFEAEIYWIQHLLIYLIIPPYLLSLGGVYKTEGMWDFSWCFFTAGFLHNYHFICLQGLGLLTEVNLNVMVCPAPNDPFYGLYYRAFAFTHQHMLFPLHIKTYTYVAKSLVLRDQEDCNGHVGDIKKID